MTAKEKEQKQLEFIALRCGGSSYDEIAQKLKVSKPALIAWGRLYKSQIDQAHQAAVIDALEAGKHTRAERLKKALELYKETETAINERLKSGNDGLRDLMTMRETLKEEIADITRKANADHELVDEHGHSETVLARELI